MLPKNLANRVAKSLMLKYGCRLTEGEVCRGYELKRALPCPNITSNSHGISLGGGSLNNRIFHNNFMSNTQQAVAEDWYSQFWDDGYPSGGNYWSDYTGVDFHSGPYQNLSGSDGIGDTPYVIDKNNQDDYLLMSPWSPKTPVEVPFWM